MALASSGRTRFQSHTPAACKPLPAIRRVQCLLQGGIKLLTHQLKTYALSAPRACPDQEVRDAAEKKGAEGEAGAGGCDEYECVVLLLLSAVTEWCSWALPAAYVQVCPG